MVLGVTDAERAAAAWAAAYPDKPLPGEAAIAAGDGLHKAFNLLLVRRAHERRGAVNDRNAYNEQVATHAEALLSLLEPQKADDGVSFSLLASRYPDLDLPVGEIENGQIVILTRSEQVPAIEIVRDGLKALAVAAREGIRDPDTEPCAGFPAGFAYTAAHAVIYRLATAYEAIANPAFGTGIRAGVSKADVKRATPYGPFVRFVEEAYRQFGEKAPSPHTIEDAMGKRPGKKK